VKLRLRVGENASTTSTAHVGSVGRATPTPVAACDAPAKMDLLAQLRTQIARPRTPIPVAIAIAPACRRYPRFISSPG
jgi:hypothetical protein